MLILTLLLVLKTFLFIDITEIEHNMLLVFFVSTSFSFLIISWLYTMKSKRKRLYIGIYYTVISLIQFADILYYSHFQTLPSVAMLAQMKLLPNVSSSVKSLVSFKEVLFILDLPLVYYFLRKRMTEIDDFIPKKMRNFIPVSFVMLLMILFSYTEINNLDNSLIYQEPYAYHFNDLADQFSIWTKSNAQGYEISEERIEELKNRAKLKEGNFTGIGQGKNLIVIQVEALQEFVVGLDYFGQEITPNLNKLIENQSSIYFNNYYQVTGRGNTSDAEFVTNNSLYPATDAPSYSQYENNSFYGLPWLLRDNGYSALAFHGYEKEFWNRNKAYSKIGFERFYSQEDFDFTESIGLGIRDEDFFSQSVDKLVNYRENSQKPFYAFMVTLTSHDPFEMPEKYKEIKLSREYENTIIGDYLNSIHYFDYSLGLFIEDLKEAGLYDNTVIAIYGDHFAIQDNLESHDLMSKLIGNNYGPEEIMKIPMLIHIPGEKIHRINSMVGSQVDFYPTIQNIMGLDNNRGLIYGRDLNNYKDINLVIPHSVMEEGSFISDEVIFKVPKTRIFEESIALDKQTEKEVDINKYKSLYKQVLMDKEECEFLLKNNLLKEILEDI